MKSLMHINNNFRKLLELGPSFKDPMDEYYVSRACSRILDKLYKKGLLNNQEMEFYYRNVTDRKETNIFNE